jgi:excisionase family DNA binding protein|tara:strand:- start:324 stop:494 length:171 start_codon:yes stop_codon:yes gene_type:complete
MTIEQHLKPSKVAEKLDVSTYTVMRWIKEGKLPAVKIAGSWRVKESDADVFAKGKA